MLALLDEDGDGTVTQFEYQAFLKRQAELGRDSKVDDLKLWRYDHPQSLAHGMHAAD